MGGPLFSLWEVISLGRYQLLWGIGRSLRLILLKWPPPSDLFYGSDRSHLPALGICSLGFSPESFPSLQPHSTASFSSTFSKNVFFLIFETVINVCNEIRSHSPSISTLSKSPSDKTPHNIIFLFDDPLSPISAAHMGINMGPSIKRNDPPSPGTLYCQKLLSKGRSLESCIICARSSAVLVLCR